MLNFLKEFSKKEQNTTSIKSLDPGARNSLFNKLFSLDRKYEKSSLTIDNISQMLKDIDISYAIRKLNSGILGREWKIKCINKSEINDISAEIEKRFSKLNMHNFVRNIHKIKYYGYGAFEIIWDEDFTMKDIVNIPQEIITHDSSRGWIVDKIDLEGNPFKIQIFINEEEINKANGKSELEAIKEIYEAKKGITTKLRNIADKYGDIITVFAYDPNEDAKDIEEKAQQIKNMRGSNVIAIPTWEKSLSDSMHFITLMDLKTEVHTELEDRWKNSIYKYILSADYSTATSSVGSLSRDEVQNKEQEKQEEEILKFFRECFQKLLEIDAAIYAYDSNNYIISFEKEIEKDKTIELEKKEIEKDKIIVETLAIAGLTLSKEYFSEKFGIEEKYFENATIKEFAKSRRTK